MATAYTPGLKVTSRASVRKTRRLPLKGDVLVKVGESVEPDVVVARTEIPGIMRTVRVAETLGVEPSELQALLKVAVGDKVERGTILAATKSFFGLLKSDCKSPIDGTVELLSPTTGHVGIRYKPTPVEVRAYIRGNVVDVIPGEGVVVETSGAFIQGIFGVGGERLGEIKLIVKSADEIIEESNISDDCAGKVLVGGSNISGDGLRRAAAIGAAGVVVGGIIDSDLIGYLGYDIGVAITGQEDIPTTLIVTEGFGVMRMAHRTFELLKSLEDRVASINGATQIRAGVIRPEIIVPSMKEDQAAEIRDEEQSLDIGAKIRIIREPNFGILGKVAALPAKPVVIESGAKVRILEADLENGVRVSVPRANVEIIQE